MGISCVVLNYNDAPTVSSLIKKIETYEVIEHIVIVDNCSTDNSVEKLIGLKSEKVQMLISAKNGGYGYGNNLGLRYIFENYHSDKVLICNPDVLFSEELIIKMMNVMDKDELYAVVSAIPCNIKGQVQKGYAWMVPTIAQCVLGSGKILQKFFRFDKYPKDYCLKRSYTEVECVPGSLLLVKSDIMKEHGMYDEEVFLYAEETILGFKLKQHGYKTIILNEKFIHNHSVSINKSITSTVEQRRIMYESFMVYIKKYRKANELIQMICKMYFSIILYENYLDGIIRKVKAIGKE